MENMVISSGFWRDKRVLVTGHTGFKGGWLSLWLNELGAKVYGYSLAPSCENVFYKKVFSNSFFGDEQFSDITDCGKISECINTFKPEIVFHLAAQPLVRVSYSEPVSTFATNAMGVVNILEAVRKSDIEPIIINVTTDKVYANKEWMWAYREPDALGGNDPYSASKACSELIAHSYMHSFFQNSQVKIATARAGNVIGGGDMSFDRLVPDYLRSIEKNEQIVIRNPQATRPWQHVLEPVLGYLQLAERISTTEGHEFIGAWNFGPSGDPFSVSEVVDKITEISGGKKYQLDPESNPYEAQALMLDSAKARKLLSWKPKLTIDEALKLTFDWFQSSLNGSDMCAFTIAQIKSYSEDE